MSETRTLRAGIAPPEFQRQAAAHFDSPRAKILADVAAQTGTRRDITIQVVDRLGREWVGRWRVHLHAADTEGGDPSAANVTGLSVTTGALIHTKQLNAAWELYTSDQGTLVVRLFVTSPATKFLYADVEELPDPVAEEGLEWDGGGPGGGDAPTGEFIDGAPVYEKTVSIGALPNTTTKTVAHGVTGLTRIVSLEGTARRAGDNMHVAMPNGA